VEKQKSLSVPIAVAVVGGTFAILGTILTTGLQPGGWLRSSSGDSANGAELISEVLSDGEEEQLVKVLEPAFPGSIGAYLAADDQPLSLAGLLKQNIPISTGLGVAVQFTVANTSEIETALLTRIYFKVWSFEVLPPFTLVMPDVLGASMQPAIHYEAEVDSSLLDTEQIVVGVPASGTVPEFAPRVLQRFEGPVQFSSYGLYTLVIGIHYDSTAGRSEISETAPFQVYFHGPCEQPPGAFMYCD
jgi:hypothetical protein